MRDSNANFDAYLVRADKQPLYALELDGISDVYTTMSYSGTPSKPLLNLPATTSQQVRPEEGRGSISAMSFQLLDKDLYITGLLKDTAMRGRKAVFKFGFLGLAYADFLEIYTGYVEAVGATPDMLSYSFAVRDIQVFGNQRLFVPYTTKLSGDINELVLTIPVDSTDGFETSGYAAMESEVFHYTSKTGTQFNADTRGVKGTIAAAHKSGKKVQEFIVLGDGGVNPLTAFLQILISTGTGSAGTYDVLPAHWGLAVDPALIDVTEIEDKRDESIPTLVCEYRLAAPEAADKFIAAEFFKLLGAYPIIKGDGKLSLTFFDRPRPVPLKTLQRFDMTNVRDVSGYAMNLDRTYNVLDWEYDWDPLEKTYDMHQQFRNQESIDKYGAQPPRVYSSKGMRTDLIGYTFASDRSGVIFFRFAVPPPTLMAVCHLSTMLVEAGDHILFSHKLPRNLRTGKQGFVFAIMEVVDRRIDLGQAKVQLALQFITFNRNYALWAPPGVRKDGSYDDTVLLTEPNESEEHKAFYGFWADDNGRNGSDTLDGDLWA